MDPADASGNDVIPTLLSVAFPLSTEWEKYTQSQFQFFDFDAGERMEKPRKGRGGVEEQRSSSSSSGSSSRQLVKDVGKDWRGGYVGPEEPKLRLPD